jgi:hypothetical protein
VPLLAEAMAARRRDSDWSLKLAKITGLHRDGGVTGAYRLYSDRIIRQPYCFQTFDQVLRTEVGFMLCDCAFGRKRRPYHAYSGRPLKTSHLGYSPGQPISVFIGAYRAQIPKDWLRRLFWRPKKRSRITYETDLRTSVTPRCWPDPCSEVGLR